MYPCGPCTTPSFRPFTLMVSEQLPQIKVPDTLMVSVMPKIILVVSVNVTVTLVVNAVPPFHCW